MFSNPSHIWPDAYRFEPKEDMTAFELALILKDVGPGPQGCPLKRMFLTAGTPVNPVYARHFERAPDLDQKFGQTG